MTPSAIFFVLRNHLADVLEIQAAIEGGFDGEHIDVEPVEIGQRGFVRLVLARDPLRRWTAPAGVTPYLAFAAQAFHLDVECLDPLLRLDWLPGVGNHLVDCRFLDLHERGACIGECVIFLVECNRQIHQQVEPVFVVLIRKHQRQDLRRDRANLYRFVGHRRDRFIGAVKLQCCLADLARHRRCHSRLDHFPHQIAWSFISHKAGRRDLHARRADAGDTLGDVTHPATAGDVIIEPRVAINKDVDTSPVLGCHMAGETIEMLLAIGEAGKSVGERNAAEILRVPAWTGERPGRRGEKSPAFCGCKHASFSRFHQ